MFHKISALSLLMLFAMAFAPAYAQQATPVANTIVVINLNDSGPGSLFQATNDAQAVEAAGGSTATVTFAPGLTGTIQFGVHGLYITQNLRIDGPGPDKLELDGPILIGTLPPTIHPQFSISNVSIAHAYQAIDNLGGTIHIEHVIFHDNIEGNAGSIVNAGGTIYINDSVFTNKDTLYDISNSSDMTISNSLFKEDGGILNRGKMLVFNSTFQNDYTFVNVAQTEIVNSTFKRDHGNIFLIQSGAEIGIPSPTLKMANTILYSATNSPKCIGPIVDEGSNFQFPGNDCGTSIPTVDPKLGTLSDNGGLTQTIPLLPGSPAIGAGDPRLCASVLQNRDQRGMPRNANGKCDIGAFEFGSASPAATPSL